jgi:hypothetical protein
VVWSGLVWCAWERVEREENEFAKNWKEVRAIGISLKLNHFLPERDLCSL